MASKRNRSGLSLIETMISMGILTIGAAMLALAFPLAMLDNKQSIEDTMGTIVMENAAAICRSRLRHSTLDGTLDTLDKISSVQVGTRDRQYPMGDPSGLYGWLVAARQPVRGRNDYQLAIVAYRKFRADDTAPTHLKFVDVQITGGKVPPSTPSTPCDFGAVVLWEETDAAGHSVLRFGFVRNTNTGAIKPDTTVTAPGLMFKYDRPEADRSPVVGCLLLRTAVQP